MQVAGIALDGYSLLSVRSLSFSWLLSSTVLIEHLYIFDDLNEALLDAEFSYFIP